MPSGSLAGRLIVTLEHIFVLRLPLSKVIVLYKTIHVGKCMLKMYNEYIGMYIKLCKDRARYIFIILYAKYCELQHPLNNALSTNICHMYIVSNLNTREC